MSKASPGINIPAIEKELSSLWKQAGEEGDDGGVIRACLLNLMVYVPDSEEANKVDEIIMEVSAEHPARAILMIADREASESALSAEVTSRCTLPAGLSKQVCCEQVTIHGSGEQANEIPSAVVPLLLSDLPTYLWWRAVPQLTDKFFKRLGDVSDRVIIDSADFADQYKELQNLAALLRDNPRWTALSDLNWARLTVIRALLAGFYDVAEYRPTLENLSQASIEYAPMDGKGGVIPARALLLAGWLTSRLGWKLGASEVRRAGGSLSFDVNAGSRNVTLEMVPTKQQEVEPGHVAGVTLTTAEPSPASFSLRRSADGSRIVTEVKAGGKQHQRVLGYERSDEVALIGRELEILGHDRVYEQAAVSAGEIVGFINS
ncbi:MAG TPA: glucose-6-phosphate dehydrogenase assembly protein OpcA [Blastocatellia bacterium]|nr:glucose-6-phosphate dehydrogenase assembly protein OpcA [Blastocatellia bacterium]